MRVRTFSFAVSGPGGAQSGSMPATRQAATLRGFSLPFFGSQATDGPDHPSFRPPSPSFFPLVFDRFLHSFLVAPSDRPARENSSQYESTPMGASGKPLNEFDASPCRRERYLDRKFADVRASCCRKRVSEFGCKASRFSQSFGGFHDFQDFRTRPIGINGCFCVQVFDYRNRLIGQKMESYPMPGDGWSLFASRCKDILEVGPGHAAMAVTPCGDRVSERVRRAIRKGKSGPGRR